MRANHATIHWSRLAALALACLLLTVASRPLRAAVDFPDPLRLSPLEARMLADPAGGQFQRYSLIEAALVASGVERTEELDRYRQKYVEWRDEARRICRREESPRRRAEAVFEFMHREILTGGYDSRATELAHLFDEGTFNCASATVMFTALATDCGLNVHAVERPRHAMSALYIDGERTDIETTCPTWFQITPAVRRQAELAALTRSAAVDYPAGCKEICPAALVAVIYYNRGVDLLREKRFAEAVSVNLRALRLDPENETAQGNLLASINNWALARCECGEYRDAADLLAEGRRIAPDHESFHANQRHVYRTWIQSLSAAGSAEEAVQVLSAARKADPTSVIWSLWSQRLGM